MGGQFHQGMHVYDAVTDFGDIPATGHFDRSISVADDARRLQPALASSDSFKFDSL